MSQSPRKFNYTKWSFILGTPLALIGAATAVVTVPDIGCKVGWNPSACITPQKEIDLITQAETGESLSGVKIQFIAKGAPEIQYTDNNGYAKVQIPSRGDVRVNLSKQGYPVQDFTINLENSQSTVRVIRFSQSGQPSVEQVASLPQSPTPSLSPSPNPASSIPLPSSAGTVGTATTLLQTECQSATAGSDLNGFLGKADNFQVTLGREVLPLLVFMQDWYYKGGKIYRVRPIEFVCNLKSSYKELRLVFGVHGGNELASPSNKLTFSVFVDNKPAGTRQVVVGSKQELSVNLQGVNNVALRAECTVETCPSLSFTEMALK